MVGSAYRLGQSGECLNCGDLDFYDIFGSEFPPEVNPITFRDAFANAEICAFCRLLTQLTRQFTPHQVVDRRGSELVTFFFTAIRHRATPTELGSPYLEVIIYPPPSPLDVDKRLGFNLIPLAEPFTGSLCHRLSQDHIDLDICRRWITNCEQEHTQCGAFSRPAPYASKTAFRLIDVIDECVVVPPADAQYISLSYVWGHVQTLELNKRNVSILSQKGSLFAQDMPVAQTIVDAITVVKALGERYLWVDMLCIIQDGSDKGMQIKSMDWIYGAALLGIVAADGDNANAGLPGVRVGTRAATINQICDEVRPGFLLAATLETPINPAGSVWSSRGWTFQEQLLSRRLLVFHCGMVLWQCRTAFLCEDAPAAVKAAAHQLQGLEQLSPRWARPEIPLRSVHTQMAGQLQGITEPLYRPAVFVEYAKAVKEYTKRNLTSSDDIINAFEGISSQLGHHFGSSFLAALPESYLDVALLWTPAVLQTRRETHQAQFPSWSWAGWVGQAEFDATSPDGREWIKPTAKWYHKDGLNAPLLVNEVGIGIHDACFGRNLSSNTVSWTPIFESTENHSQEAPAVESADLRGTYLQLWTSCSFFTVVRRRVLNQLQEYSAAQRPIEAQIYSARGSRRQLAGNLVLNGDGPSQTIEGKHEFIVLSSAQIKGFDPITGNMAYSDEALMYNVMLVEWDDRHQIASRLGVGRILKTAWDVSQPTIRLVTIG